MVQRWQNHWKTINADGALEKNINHSIAPKKWPSNRSSVFNVFGVFRIALPPKLRCYLYVFIVFNMFGVFHVFDVSDVFSVQKMYHVFDVFTCLQNFFSKKYSMCLTCLAFLRVWEICSPKNIPCVLRVWRVYVFGTCSFQKLAMCFTCLGFVQTSAWSV